MSRLKKGAAITAVAVALVGGFEGLRTVAYRDVVGVPTVCFGETRGVKMGDKYTVAECKEMLAKGLADFERGMAKCIKNPDAVPDKTYVAFLSFSYNVGTGGFCKSTLVKKLNAGDLRGACNELLKWDKAKGKRIGGLTRRRAEERKLCLEGVAEGAPKVIVENVPVPQPRPEPPKIEAPPAPPPVVVQPTPKVEEPTGWPEAFWAFLKRIWGR